MAGKKRSGMGSRGINVMLTAKRKSEETAANDSRIDKVAIEALQAGVYQPRVKFDEAALKDLSESIRVQGIVQPIVVRAVDDEKYEIIAGERRWRAAKMANLTEVPVVIRSVDSQTALAMALIENMQRKDLSPLEEARGFERMMNEFEVTQAEVAEAIGRSRSSVTNLLRILKLPESIQQLIEDEKLSVGHARAIITLKAAQQSKLAEKAIAEDWSVRRMESEVAKLQQTAQPAAKKEPSVNFEREESHLGRFLEAPVKINQRNNGSGKIEISYKTQEELNRLMTLIRP